MKTGLIPTGKYIAVMLMLLYATNSFSQRAYYPNKYDSSGKERPTLIKQNFLYYGILSSVNNHISFEYDRWINDDYTLSGQLGIINSSFSQATGSTVSGAYVEAGIKLFFNPDYSKSGRHDYFAEEGLYLKPQLVLSIFNSTSTTYYSSYVYPPPLVTNQYSYVGGAVLICLGGQWIVAHTIMIDLYGGFGCSFNNANDLNEPLIYNYYSYLTAGSNFPLAVTGGINIGLPF